MAAQAEVGHPCVAPEEQDISGAQVPVEDPVGEGVAKPERSLEEEPQLGGQRGGRGSLDEAE